MKGIAHDKINVNQKLKSVLRRVENIMGKGENAGHQHFLFSHNIFKWLFTQGCYKS